MQSDTEGGGSSSSSGAGARSAPIQSLGVEIMYLSAHSVSPGAFRASRKRMERSVVDALPGLQQLAPPHSKAITCGQAFEILGASNHPLQA
eukprot:gene13544-biopygen8033